MVYTRSNMQLADLNSNHHDRKILIDIIDRTIVTCFYSSPGSEHYKLLLFYQFHRPSHINNNHKNKNQEDRIMHHTKTAKISYACKNTIKTRANICICTYMNNQIITNHPRLSIFICFICADQNNQMIANHPRLSSNDKHITRKSCPASLSSVYIPI